MSTLLQERLTGIGGSDLHHLWNLEPYGCARRLAYEKLEIKPDYPQDETPAMRRGKFLEEAAAQEYALITGNTVFSRAMLRHPEHPWAIVHVDRFLADQTAVVEIKVPARENFFRIIREGLPDAYILQAQQGMWLADYEYPGAGARCEFVVFNADLWRCVPFGVERDDDLIGNIAAAGDEFWERLEFARKANSVESELPERLAPDSRQCQRCPWRTSCQGQNLIPVKERGPLDRDESLSQVVSEYVEAKQIEDEVGDLVAAARERLEKALGERPGVEVEGFRVHFRGQPGAIRTNEPKAREAYRAAHVKVGLDGELIWPAEADVVAGIKERGKPSRPLRVYAI